jgi:protein-export membrane protein SecD/preprotein translocase SecF subunit
MSGRLTKWLLIVALPLVVALYASYPAVGVAVEKRLVRTALAQTPEEAKAHGVAVGERYEVSKEVTWKRFLPLAYGQREEVRRFVERQPDGTVVEEVTTIVQGRVKLGLDIAGGTELLYQLKPEEGEALTGQVTSVIEILKKRIDPSNVKEYRIQALENDRILIQVPQATSAEVEQLKTRLEKMGKLEFKLAVPRPGETDNPEFLKYYEDADKGRVPAGYVKMWLAGAEKPHYFLVKDGPPEITGRYLAPGRLRPTTDNFGRPAVGFEFNTTGAGVFARITDKNQGWCLAIILDGSLKSAPVIRNRIYGPGIIEGTFTQAEVQDMVNVLRAGSLPLDIQLLQENTVGPQLGRDSIQKGMVAFVVGCVAVFAFIAGYYLLCGLVADAALLMNIILLVGALCVLGAALTLPGLAGVVLTVGMAVDANVLINERIREEVATGKGARLALRNGYDRAFITIFDSNATTVLTAVVLYLVGTGPVRGFAVTLSLGLALNMFTALTVTRLIFETLLDTGRLQQFRMLSAFGTPHINFTGARKVAYVGSAALAVIGLVAFLVRGSALYDIDFTGGTLVQLSLAKPTSVGVVRERLAKGGFPRAEVQGIRTGRGTKEGLTDFGIRIKGTAVDAEAARGAVQLKLTQAGLMSKGDTLSVSADRRALTLSLAKSVAEMQVRRALGEAGDPYDLKGIASIASPPDVLTARAAVHLAERPPVAAERELWAGVLRALAVAGVRREDLKIVRCELRDGAGGRPEVLLALDGPIQPELLALELARRQFPDLEMAPEGQAGTQFVLRGDQTMLDQFQRELPAGTDLAGVPMAQVDGLTLTAELSKGFSEQDLRAFLEQQGVSGASIVPLDVESRQFNLVLSTEPVRRKMEAIFADLARPAGGVTFEALGGEPKAATLRVKMKLGEPIAFADVLHHLESAGLGSQGQTAVENREAYEPDSYVADLVLVLPADKAEVVREGITKAFNEPRPVQGIMDIGSTVAAEMQGRALLAVIFASVIIIIYVTMRFHAFKFGVAAVIALVHDLIITAGLIALADWAGVFGDVKLNLSMLAAFLTILGYSLNDTIVVYDRIRENMASQGHRPLSADLINLSINQTLGRTMLTGSTTLMVLVAQYLLGGAALQGFALTLIIGIVIGTYSSVFVASPIALDWPELTRGLGTFARILVLPVKLPFRLAGMLLGRGAS